MLFAGTWTNTNILKRSTLASYRRTNINVNAIKPKTDHIRLILRFFSLCFFPIRFFLSSVSYRQAFSFFFFHQIHLPAMLFYISRLSLSSLSFHFAHWPVSSIFIFFLLFQFDVAGALVRHPIPCPGDLHVPLVFLLTSILVVARKYI